MAVSQMLPTISSIPGNATLKNLYYRLMSNISYENHFLSLDAAKEDKTKYAEVRVLRAYSYFLMLDFFGDPTFIDKISARDTTSGTLLQFKV